MTDDKNTVCYYCREPINSNAIKCPKCQSILTKDDRWFRKINKWLTLSSLFATTTAILFIAISTCQTQKSVKLQEESLNRTDSSMIAIREQIELMRESNKYQKDLLELSLEENLQKNKEYKEENKPVVSIETLECYANNDSLELHLYFNNFGKSIASNVDISILFKQKLVNQKGKSVVYNFNTILPNTKLRAIINFSIVEYLVGQCKITWSWELINEYYNEEQYILIVLDATTKECKASFLVTKEIDKFWVE